MSSYNYPCIFNHSHITYVLLSMSVFYTVIYLCFYMPLYLYFCHIHISSISNSMSLPIATSFYTNIEHLFYVLFLLYAFILTYTMKTLTYVYKKLLLPYTGKKCEEKVTFVGIGMVFAPR